MEKANFVNAEVIKTTFENITLTRTGGKHGWRNIGTDGRGFWIRIASRKRTDFIYCWRQHLGRVSAITTFKPEIIVTNSGGAIIPGFENNPILMNEEQTILLAHCKERKVIAVHLESLTTVELREIH
jgi:hypothetical protein